ncbi:MAG: LamG domain-containing protein [bacterium]|nr:LamG domain-containing protein [bacterium]
MGSFIHRNDDDQGAVTIATAPAGFPAPDQWLHVTITTDRTSNEVEFFLGGVSQGTVPLAGAIFPSQDMQIGVINDGINAGGSRTQGMDDLAFYAGILSQADITGLANGSLTPLDFLGGIGTNDCTPAIPNSSGFAATILATGSTDVGANSLVLTAGDMPAGQFGYFLAGQTQDLFNPPGSQGLICLSGNIGRKRFSRVRLGTSSVGTGTTTRGRLRTSPTRFRSRFCRNLTVRSGRLAFYVSRFSSLPWEPPA